MESSEGPPQKPNSEETSQASISRREALKKLGILTGGAVATGVAAGVEAKLHPVRSIARRFGMGERREAERQIVSWVEDPNNPWPKSVKVGLDAEGLPVKGLLPDGSEFKVDTREMRKRQELAIKNQIPELVRILRFPAGEDTKADDLANDKDKFQPTEAHPKVEKLPEDVLSDEQLKAKGVNIIQTDEVQLYIRKSAFEEHGPLHTLQNPKRNLTIVLVDAPMATAEALEGERYDSVRSLIPKRGVGGDDYKREKMDETDKLAIELIEKYPEALMKVKEKSGNDDQGKQQEQLAKILIAAKAQPAVWQSHTTEAEIEMLITDYIIRGGDGQGKHVSNMTNPVVFTAVGDSEFSSSLAYLGFDHKGKLLVIADPATNRQTNHDAPIRKKFTPLISETHPDPEMFPRSQFGNPSNTTSYAYDAQTPGFTLRHELVHDELISTKGDRNEYYTDERAMEGIRTAWQRWVDSGYTDDSGYSFVFKTEKGLVLT